MRAFPCLPGRALARKMTAAPAPLPPMAHTGVWASLRDLSPPCDITARPHHLHLRTADLLPLHLLRQGEDARRAGAWVGIAIGAEVGHPTVVSVRVTRLGARSHGGTPRRRRTQAGALADAHDDELRLPSLAHVVQAPLTAMLDAPWSRHGSEGVSGRRRGPEACVALNEVRLCARRGAHLA
jgi:hypothetical protein